MSDHPPPVARPRDDLFLHLDRQLRITAVSEGWQALAHELGYAPFEAEVLVGRPLSSRVDREGEGWTALEAWLRSLIETPAGEAPRTLAPPIPGWADAVVPWPVASDGDEVGGSELLIALRPSFVERLDRFCVVAPRDGSEVQPLGHRAGRHFEQHAFADRAELEDWLAARSLPLRLEPSGLAVDGAPVLVARRPLAHRQSSFRLLARVLRATLHDTSNSLAGLRMLAEVIKRGGSRAYDRHTNSLDGLASQLDRISEKLGRLRRAVQAERGPKLVDMGELLDMAGDAFHSELERRELKVDAEAVPSFEVEGRADQLFLLLLGGLSWSLERASEGARLELRHHPGPPTGLELRIVGEREPTVGGGEPEPMRELARSLGVRFETGGPGRTGDWKIEWPSTTDVAEGQTR